MDIASLALELVGGLALFLYGMRLMSDSIEKAAGTRLRRVIEVFTKNKYVSIVVGMVFTAIIQSSSAATVMVVSFVNAGLMNLYQAIGIIYGANIGTTITSQLVAFNLSQYAPIIVMVGVLMTMIFKNPVVKKTGEVIIGFGILFLGISMMSSSMGSMREIPFVQQLFVSLNNRLLAFLIGLAVTAVVQSSSVTVSIVLILAQQELIPLRLCFFIILGCNIGACMSAMLAGFNGNSNAKRAALIHLLFNVIGSIIIGIIFLLIPGRIETMVLAISGGNVGRAVANTHTLIKVFQVIILMPFMNQIVNLTYRIIKDKDVEEAGEDSGQFRLQYITHDLHRLTLSTVIPRARNEINRMGQMSIGNMETAMDALLEMDSDKMDVVLEREKYISFLNKEITDFLVQANQMSLPVEDRKRIGTFFHTVSDIERISFHACLIAQSGQKLNEMNEHFDDTTGQGLREMMDMVSELFGLSMMMFVQKINMMDEVLSLESEIDEKERNLQALYVDELTDGKCSPAVGMMFSTIASNLERVANHATNIAYSLLNGKEIPDKPSKLPEQTRSENNVQ